MLSLVRWLLPALLPPAILALVVKRARRSEPIWLVALTFTLGAALGAAAYAIEARAAAWTALDVRASVAGEAGALLFLFALVEPLRESAKVAAAWGAFRFRHFDSAEDGILYAAASAFGFAAAESAIVLRAHPTGLVWIARTLLALPAHVFFAAAWGWALGRAKKQRRPGSIFPVTFLLSTFGHALYIHIIYGRRPAAIVAAAPLLVAMAALAWGAARDVRARGETIAAPPPTRRSRAIGAMTRPPSLRAVREALRRSESPILVRWIFFGALVTLGAMLTGFAASVAFGHWAHVDFSVVDEHDVATTGPVAVLASGVLLAFPASGYLIARASNVPTLLEPALATALAILVVLVLLGLLEPIGLVFALAFAPIAWALACAGAWVGRPL